MSFQFFDSQLPGSPIIFDEVHRLDDSSRLLKIAEPKIGTHADAGLE